MTFIRRVKADLSLPIWCLAALYFSYGLFFTIHDSPPEGTPIDAVYAVGFWLILSWWLWHDAKQNRFVLPMSYGFLILLAAPIYAPIYIFQTRGWMGFVTIGLYCLIFAAVILLYFATFFLLQR